MYKLQISPKAKNDLVDIKGYISQELKITKKIRLLSEHPVIGAPLSSVVDIKTDYRFVVCNNYLIFYRYEDEVVFVSRILYGRRNYMRILFGDLPMDEEE